MLRILFILFLTTNNCSLYAESPEQLINYQFKITDAAHHLGQVSIAFPKVSTKTLEVKLPVWRSGRYEILDLSKAISHFSAQYNNGNEITWEKMDKNTWKLFLNQPGDITINYQVYANTLKYRVAHIDETHAYLDASGVFMFAPTMRQQPLTVSLSVPETWQSRSGMDKIAAHNFRADDYDQLVDSPIESGIHEFLSFEVEGKTYEIVIWGKGNHDINDLKDQVTLMHFEAKNIWGDFPFERYVYMYHVGDGIGGATEHVNSTIIQQDRFNFKPRKNYLKVLATTAHEFVHTWNVKAYRPAGIAPYDYSTENYSDLFWMAEGITSYYDDLMLMRTGIYEQKEYLDKIAEDLQKHLSKPGREVESLAQTSFDTWLKDDAQQSHNSSVSIYLEGHMAAWFMDYEIRRLTNNKYGMDELQRRLYKNHHNIDRGYRKTDVLNLLQDITGKDFTSFWQQYIEGTEAIDFDVMLTYFGLEKITDEEKEQHAWIGTNLTTDNDKITIKSVDSNSPAWLAGLSAGDQILAIDGIKVTAKNIENRIHQLSLDTNHKVHYFSAGRLRETMLKPISHPSPEFKIKPLEKPNKKQKIRFKAWTGQELIND
jgi:predicted metalloprotease with PDZ domain